MLFKKLQNVRNSRRRRKTVSAGFELLEVRRMLAANVVESFRPLEFEFEGEVEGAATIVDQPSDYVVQYEGTTSGSGIINYSSPIAGTGTLTGGSSGTWQDNAGDAGTYTGTGMANVIENDGVLSATQVTGSGSSSSGLSGSIDLTGLDPADATAVIDLLSNSAASSWDLDLSALIGGPASTTGTAVVDLTPALTDPTDLAPTSGAFTAGGGVTFTVEVTGQLVPTAVRSAAVASVDVFWASGTSAADILTSASGDSVPVHWNTGQVQAELTDLTAAPTDATHLLIFADSADELAEGNEDNNVLALGLLSAGKITGGGTLDPGVRNFGFVVQTGLKKDGSLFKGNLQYQDKEAGIKLHSTSLDSLQVSANGTATFTGTARVNGVDGYHFTVVVSDVGEPGKGRDTFSIVIMGPSLSYDSTDFGSLDDTLTGGNIQFHQKGSKK